MRAFVLAGGLGTRLQPRFGELPKPLAPIGGRPFLKHQLDWLRDRGIREAVLCVGHGAEQVRSTLGDGRTHGVRLIYSIEPEPLGTGGALKLAESHVDGPALVVNGDTLPDCDPWQLEGARWASAKLGAVGLFRVGDARERGRVEISPAGEVTAFVEKDPEHRGAAWVNGGIYAFHSALWRRLPAGASSLERDILPALAHEHALLGHTFAGTFYDIGTPEDWERAERELTR